MFNIWMVNIRVIWDFQESKPQSILQIIDSTIHNSSSMQNQKDEDNTGTEISNREITDLRFGNDKRLIEVQRLLQSCDVVKTDISNPDLRFVLEF